MLNYFQLFSSRDVADQMTKIQTILSEPSNDWEKRNDAVSYVVFDMTLCLSLLTCTSEEQTLYACFVPCLILRYWSFIESIHDWTIVPMA